MKNATAALDSPNGSRLARLVSRRQVPVEPPGDAGRERGAALQPELRARLNDVLCDWLIARKLSVPCDTGSSDMKPGERRRRRTERNVLLVAHVHVPLRDEQRVGPHELDSSEVIVDAVVEVADELPAVHHDLLRTGPDRARADRDRPALLACSTVSYRTFIRYSDAGCCGE